MKKDRKKDTGAPATSRPLLPWVAAMAGGVLGFLGYVGFDQYYLEWICLVPILWAISGQAPGRAFFIGWIAGIVGHAGGFYWIVTMLRQFADAPWLLAAGGLLLLAAANGLICFSGAGNDGHDADPSTGTLMPPCDSADVIGVGAVRVAG